MIEYAHDRGLLLEFNEDDITNFRLEEAFPGRISAEQLGAIFNEPHFWQSIAPCPQLVESARTLWEEGCELFIITARFEWQCEGLQRMTRDWLENHGIPFAEVIFLESGDKPGYIRENCLEFFVEDRMDTAQKIASTGACDSYLVAMPYNNTAVSQTASVPNVYRRDRPFFPRLVNHVR
jgi:uncharacterized HAD superfamily protein